MDKEQRQNEIELRSDEFQEIVEQSPRWIIRSGISLILGFLMVFIAGSYFFSYPDLIEGSVIVYSAQPNNLTDSLNDTNAGTISAEEPLMYGKITLTMNQSHKVKPGQKVNIRLDDYPVMEYGAIEGKVMKISPLEGTSSFVAEVSMNHPIITSNKTAVKLYPEMKGSAEIVTAKIRLIERFIKPLKTFLN